MIFATFEPYPATYTYLIGCEEKPGESVLIDRVIALLGS